MGASGAIVLPGQNTAGDCVHDALSKYKVDLTAIKYNAAADSIEMDVTKILKLKITLTKSGLAIEVPEPGFEAVNTATF